MSIPLTKQTIFNFDENFLIWFKKFNKKELNWIIFSKFVTKLRLKKAEGPTWYFWTKIWIKRVIPTFLYKLVKTLYLLFFMIIKNNKIIIIVIVIIIKLNINIFYNFTIINFHL